MYRLNAIAGLDVLWPLWIVHTSCRGLCLYLGIMAQVVFWDMRGGRGPPSFGAKGPQTHNMLDKIDILSSSETSRNLDSIHLDPTNPVKLAFSLDSMHASSMTGNLRKIGASTPISSQQSYLTEQGGFHGLIGYAVGNL